MILADSHGDCDHSTPKCTYSYLGSERNQCMVNELGVAIVAWAICH